MSDLLIEHSFTCPHCWAAISTLVDLSVPEQEYVEDCEVCCRPILIRCSAVGGVLLGFEVEAD